MRARQWAAASGLCLQSPRGLAGRGWGEGMGEYVPNVAGQFERPQVKASYNISLFRENANEWLTKRDENSVSLSDWLLGPAP